MGHFSEFGLAHAFKFVSFWAYSSFLGPSSFIHWTVHPSDHTFKFLFNHPFSFSKSFIYGEIHGVKGLDRFFTGLPFLKYRLLQLRNVHFTPGVRVGTIFSMLITCILSPGESLSSFLKYTWSWFQVSVGFLKFFQSWSESVLDFLKFPVLARSQISHGFGETSGETAVLKGCIQLTLL